MERNNEIKVLLKHLLRKTENVIDKNYYTDNFDKIIKSSKDVLDIAEQIKKYIIELGENVT